MDYKYDVSFKSNTYRFSFEENDELSKKMGFLIFNLFLESKVLTTFNTYGILIKLKSYLDNFLLKNPSAVLQFQVSQTALPKLIAKKFKRDLTAEEYRIVLFRKVFMRSKMEDNYDLVFVKISHYTIGYLTRKTNKDKVNLIIDKLK